MVRFATFLKAFFKRPALVPVTPREKMVASVLVGALVLVVIVLFRPGQANRLPLPENLVAAAVYGFISFLVPLLSQLFVQNSFMKRGCTRLRLMAWLGTNLVLVGTANALASVLVFGNPPGLAPYLQVLGGTFATGIVVLAILLLWQRYVRLQSILRQRIVLEGEEVSIPADGAGQGWRLRKDRIVYMKALENYVDLFYADASGRITHRLIRSTMKRIEGALEPYRQFLRCHRSYIVNTAKVEGLRSVGGSHALQMEGVAQTIPVSRGSIRSVRDSMRRL